MSSIGSQRSPGCVTVKCMEGDGWFTAAKLGRIFGLVLISVVWAGSMCLSLHLYMASVLGLVAI